jgi:hypothetical protein
MVILMNALGLLRGSAPRPKRRYEVIYQVVAAVMVVLAAGLGILALAGSKEHTVFWLETVGISGFVVFWAVQTTELWYSTSRGKSIKLTPAPDTVAAPDANKAV